ncbi:MAG: GGDEF domain-containing protein [Clostridia bacterium]|nr:GGDEF domain-containing protein [Clostridia bacterium]
MCYRDSGAVFLLTPTIIKGWKITIQHILFLPAMIAFFVAACIFQKKNPNFKSVTALCVIFECVLFVFVILIDVFPIPHAPSSFMPLLCIALAVSFILKFRISYTVILLSHIIMRLHIKDFGLNLKYKNLSMQDPLCPILNKKACHEAIRNYFNANNPHVECSLLFLDMDDFKDINDTYGHFMGDRILKVIGDVLTSSFRSTDIIGRIGGDEFMVLLKSPSSFNLLESKCMLINTRLMDAIERSGLPPVTCSIGGVAVQRERVEFDSLFKKADAALYHAKELGRGQFVLRAFNDNIPEK